MAHLIAGNQGSTIVFPHNKTGYLDDLFAVFDRYSHPIVVVEYCAFRWMGLSVWEQGDLDLLVRDSQIDEIVHSVIMTGNYEPISQSQLGKPEDLSPIGKFRRVCCVSDEGPFFITFWSESAYHLSVDDEKVEVPNAVPLQRVLIEDRFNMKQPFRFHHAKMTERKTPFVPLILARTPKDDAPPIYIPSIPRMVEALIRQALYSPTSNIRLRSSDSPSISLGYFIRYLRLTEPEQRAKILSALSIATRGEMQRRLDKWVPKQIAWISLPSNELPVEKNSCGMEITVTEG